MKIHTIPRSIKRPILSTRLHECDWACLECGIAVLMILILPHRALSCNKQEDHSDVFESYIRSTRVKTQAYLVSFSQTAPSFLLESLSQSIPEATTHKSYQSFRGMCQAIFRQHGKFAFSHI
jgi:hypothetical protein